MKYSRKEKSYIVKVIIVYVRIEAINLKSGLAVFKVNNNNYGWLKVFDINLISIGDILEGDFDAHITGAFNITKNSDIKIDCDMGSEVEDDNVDFDAYYEIESQIFGSIKRATDHIV